MFFINLTDVLGQSVSVNVAHIVAFGPDNSHDAKAMLILSVDAKPLYVKQTQIEIMAQINRVTGKVAHV
jgi:hypothetical protein